MRVQAEQNEKHGIEPGIVQVFVVLVLVMPSLFAFLASLTFDSSWGRAPGLWLFYQMSLNIGYGAIPVAVGLTALSIYGGDSSARTMLAMAALSATGIVLTWYAGQL
jgi:hypothetical protein